MRSTILSAATVALSAVQMVKAQTFTSCNPTSNSSCPSDPGMDATVSCDFTTEDGLTSAFTVADGTTLKYGDNGAEFIINKYTDAPTISSNDYMFFGNVEVVTQAAAGTGIISSFVMESDDLDEIDWEWLGGNTTVVETNYFGKGNTTTYDRAIYYAVSEPQSGFHTYTIDWTAERIVWSIDGTDVRTLEYADAVGGTNYPQTPMRIKMGNWDGGAPTEPEGTIEWAGGLTDLSDAPFTMYVKSVKMTNYNPGKEYTYSDLTGSYESIAVSNSTDTDSSSSSSSSSTKTGSSASSSAGATGTNNTSSSATTSATPTTTSLAPIVSLNPAVSYTIFSSVSFTAPTSSISSATPAATSYSNSTFTSSSPSSSPTGSTTSDSNSDSSSNSASSTSSSASATSSSFTGAASSSKPSRYGMADYVVVGLGLVCGYLFM